MNETVEIAADFAAVADEWDELAERVRAIPFVHAGALEAWWRAFGDGELEIVTVRRGGRLVGAAALQRRGKIVRSPTNAESSDFGLVAEDDEARATLADALLARCVRSLELQRLDAAADDLPILRSAARSRKLRTHERVLERAPYLEVAGDWETYLRGRKSKFVGSWRRRQRLLAEQGTVTCEIDDGREGLPERLAEGYGIEGSGWKVAEGTAIASRPDARRFYDELAAWAARRGTLRLAFLRLDGRAVGFKFTLEHDGVLYICKEGYDESYRRFGPGTLLTAELLERAFAGGLRRVEFLGADEPWKLDWTDTVRELRQFDAFAATPVGVGIWAAERWGRPLARRLGAGRARALLRR